MMGVDFADLVGTQAHSRRRRRTAFRPAVDRRPGQRSGGVLPQQLRGGLSLLTRRFGIRGYASAVHTACASGGQALGTALKLIRRGARRPRAGRRLRFDDQPGRHQRLLPAVGAVARQRYSAAREPSVRRVAQRLPAGRGRGLPRARGVARGAARGARIYAELAGDGNSLSSYRITDSPPDGDGPIQAMRQALWSAGAAPADIDYLNAHGTSTGMNDRSESAAIKAVFGSDVRPAVGQFHQEHDGSPDRRRGRRGGRGVRAGDRATAMPINANLTKCAIRTAT
jgi:hypothetical protein